MIVRGRRKLVAGPDKTPKMLFDLDRDPYQMRNLVGQRSHLRLLGELQSLL
jgi:arylsulfatase A-like enzyme